MSEPPTRGERLLRASVLFAVSAEIGFIFLPFTLPALILARQGRWHVLAAVLAAAGAVAYFALWLELLDELHLPS